MMLGLFLQAAWKVLLAGLVLGAGLPALFALGIRFTAAGTGGMTVPVARAQVGSRVLGVACFVVVAVAVALGITVIVASGFGKMLSFEQIFPTLVEKA